MLLVRVLKFVETRLQENNTKKDSPDVDHNGDSPRVQWRTSAQFARDEFETILGLLKKTGVLHQRYMVARHLTMTSPPIELSGDENYANRKGQTNVPGGEGGGEGETARQASGEIAGREKRRPEARV